MPYQLYPWQKDCLDSWFAHQTKGCVGAVTGAGKTILAMFAILELEQSCARPLRVKVIVPTIAVLNQWLHTFHKFFSEKKPGSYDRMQAGCWYGHHKRNCCYMVYVINSARYVIARHIKKDIDEGYDVLMIADECHHYDSPENRHIFDFLPLCDKSRFHSLGLSATPSGGALPLGPEIYRYGFSQALRLGNICPFSILQIALSFNAAELGDYTDYSTQMAAIMLNLKKRYPYLARAEGGAFFSAVKHLASESGGEDENAKNYLNLAYLRKGVVCMAQARIDCLSVLIRQFDPESRILIFCERIEQAEKVYSRLNRTYSGQIGRYHSGLPQLANKNALRAFREHETRILISCRALDEGVDVPDANVGVVLSGTSTRRQHIQRLGRILRVAGGKENAVLYYFYVKQSAEGEAYFSKGDQAGVVCSLSFDAHDGSFLHNAYESAALRILDGISAKTSDPDKLKEARRCLMEGIAKPDWLGTPEYCDRKLNTVTDTHERNYWICMKKMCELGRGC